MTIMDNLNKTTQVWGLSPTLPDLCFKRTLIYFDPNSSEIKIAIRIIDGLSSKVGDKIQITRRRHKRVGCR